MVDTQTESQLQDTVASAYESSRNDVYFYLLRLGLSSAEAQDTTQESFLRLYSSLKDGAEILNPRAWVFRVAHNLAVNLATRRRETSELTEEHVSVTQDPEEAAADAIRNQRIHAALSDLSPQQRQCLHLRAEGLKYREIADTLGITTSTVNEFVRRAIAKLRKVLHE
ncbi:MAG TPA: RNA polymerase sigma factor [Bryobacteraceae bacterium]|nr:RNA polymerase sigma factor [Bryobacteraceae bacterium]